MKQQQIDCVERRDFEDETFNDAERALMAFGREVIENVRVSDATFTAMRKNFSAQEIVETILTIGFYMMMARLSEATEVDLDPADGIVVYESSKPRSA